MDNYRAIEQFIKKEQPRLVRVTFTRGTFIIHIMEFPVEETATHYAGVNKEGRLTPFIISAIDKVNFADYTLEAIR